MKFLTALTLSTFLFTAHANVDHASVEKQIDHMVADKVISVEEGRKAKARLQTMSPEQWSALNRKAEVKAKAQMSRAPASVDRDFDLQAAQMNQIENDMQMIMFKGSR